MRLQGKKEYSLWSVYPELFVNKVKIIGEFNGNNASMKITENTGLVNTVIKARIKE